MPVADLEQFSRLLIWTAVALYAVAFLVYSLDLSRRADAHTEKQDVRARELVAASGEIVASPAPTITTSDPRPPKRFVLARIATSLTWFALVLHLGGVVLRGVAAPHAPWSNMYEFAISGTAAIVAVYLLSLLKVDLRFLGTIITGLVVVVLGAAAYLIYIPIVPLPDPLRSVWFVVHVSVATLGVAFLALAGALSVVQLMRHRREARVARAETVTRSFLDALPTSAALESLAYRVAIVGFVLWTFTLIAGAIWANDAWGRYWGFDTKEVWTFVIWVIYAGYIHARATRGWRGAGSAWLSIVGFIAVIFNFAVINVYFQGLHAYSGLN
ncbi:c-type cytochrome biogenesis protein CcsB [Microbacterium gorillae]|uniref:c-type cytochrome biogenesis protein CcsB n=1 Tax=Microbacterium gorillae TaxID=1231063 RepID=UPI00058D8E3D|nr:c-type cytochrome biogenesis protein CcsB [Microbacterium gorillae]